VNHISNISHTRNPIETCKRDHKRRMRKDPTLAACEPGGGWIEANGQMLVCLPLIDGTIIAYAVTTTTQWSIARKEKLPKHLEPLPKSTPAEGERDRAKTALNILLNVLSDAEHRVAS
jgi:hypothetical protein